MFKAIRAFITEVDDAGISRFRSTDVIEPKFVRTPVGDQHMERTGTLWQVWGTPDGFPVFQDQTEPVLSPAFPGPGGTRFALFSLPPDSEVTSVADREGEDSGDALGVADTHASEGDTTFHATNTIDYMYVVEGEIVLELDEGKREVVSSGSCIVQRGTLHAWRNESSKPALFVLVTVGVEGGL